MVSRAGGSGPRVAWPAWQSPPQPRRGSDTRVAGAARLWVPAPPARLGVSSVRVAAIRHSPTHTRARRCLPSGISFKQTLDQIRSSSVNKALFPEARGLSPLLCFLTALPGSEPRAAYRHSSTHRDPLE